MTGAIQRRDRRPLLVALALLLALAGGLMTPAPVVAATTITVTTNADEDVANGSCSLREAIIAANTNAAYRGCTLVGSGAPFMIVLQTGGVSYTLTTSVPDATIGATGLPTITSPITINGNGATITRTAAQGTFRILRIASTGNATLRNLTIANGLVSLATSLGGGIYNEGSLTIDTVALTNNAAFAVSPAGTAAQPLTAEGGGIYNTGPLTITNSQINGRADMTSANTASAAARGGAIANVAPGVVTITSSTIASSQANAGSTGDDAGAIGGGIYSTGTLTVTGSTINSNTALANGVTTSSAVGGGIAFDGNSRTFTLTNSTLNANGVASVQTAVGGGIFLGRGAGSIVGSTLSGNVAATIATLASATAVGGGIANFGMPLTLANSTLSGNRVTTTQASGAARGGGLVNTTLATTTVTNATITANLVTQSGGSGAVLQGGGISHDGNTITLTNTIVAGNMVGGSASASTANCLQTVATTSGGHNLTVAATGCPTGGAGDLTVIVADVFAKVLNQTLAANGGPTRTHALLTDGPAIDAGDTAVCAAAPVSNLDQRGSARPLDGDANSSLFCDIGAYEAPTRLPQLPTVWYFAEGYTGTGFDQYLTIQNPDTRDATVTITYNRTDLSPLTTSFVVPANSRDTVNVHETARGVGRVDGRAGGLSAKVESTNNVGLIVERPMYFAPYSGETVGIPGGHDVMGTSAPRPTWYFAEGFTATGFDEYLTIQNPNATVAVVTITYYLTGAAPVTKIVQVPANQRYTVAVHQDAEGVGRNGGAGWPVAAKVTTSNPGGIVVERPMYFTYTGSMGLVKEGHNVMGATGPRPTWFFPAGETTIGIDTYVTLLNPTPRDIATTLTYYVVGQPSPSTKVIIVPRESRSTVAVHGDADGVGRGKSVSIKIEAADVEGLVAERPIYFANGAYSALGAPEARPAWFFAEGYTGPGFAESLVILNPNAGSAAVRITYFLDTGAPVVKTLTIAGQQRTTINVNDTTLGVGPGRPVSAKVESTNGVTIVAERPMVFTYNGVTKGAHTVIGFAP